MSQFQINGGGSGSGGGGVTSFTGDGTLISNSGSTGAVTATLASASGNEVFATPNGSSGAGSYRALVSADLPSSVTNSFVNFTTAGVGWFVGGCTYPQRSAGVIAFNNTTDKQLRGIEFVLPFGITVSKITLTMSGVLASSKIVVGIYDSGGNLKIDSGQFDGSSATTQTLSITATALAAGLYKFVWCTSGGSSTNTSATGIDLGAVVATIVNKNVARSFTAANAYSGTAMPPTLGALTNFAQTTIPAVLFEA